MMRTEGTPGLFFDGVFSFEGAGGGIADVHNTEYGHDDLAADLALSLKFGSGFDHPLGVVMEAAPTTTAAGKKQRGSSSAGVFPLGDLDAPLPVAPQGSANSIADDIPPSGDRSPSKDDLIARTLLDATDGSPQRSAAGGQRRSCGNNTACRTPPPAAAARRTAHNPSPVSSWIRAMTKGGGGGVEGTSRGGGDGAVPSGPGKGGFKSVAAALDCDDDGKGVGSTNGLGAPGASLSMWTSSCGGWGDEGVATVTANNEAPLGTVATADSVEALALIIDQALAGHKQRLEREAAELAAREQQQPVVDDTSDALEQLLRKAPPADAPVDAPASTSLLASRSPPASDPGASMSTLESNVEQVNHNYAQQQQPQRPPTAASPPDAGAGPMGEPFADLRTKLGGGDEGDLGLSVSSVGHANSSTGCGLDGMLRGGVANGVVYGNGNGNANGTYVRDGGGSGVVSPISIPQDGPTTGVPLSLPTSPMSQGTPPPTTVRRTLRLPVPKPPTTLQQQLKADQRIPTPSHTPPSIPSPCAGGAPTQTALNAFLKRNANVTSNGGVRNAGVRSNDSVRSGSSETGSGGGVLQKATVMVSRVYGAVIGLLVKGTTIQKVLDNSPGAMAGLREGMRILAINHTDMDPAASTETLLQELRRHWNTAGNVVLTVEHSGPPPTAPGKGQSQGHGVSAHGDVNAPAMGLPINAAAAAAAAQNLMGFGDMNVLAAAAQLGMIGSAPLDGVSALMGVYGQDFGGAAYFDPLGDGRWN